MTQHISTWKRLVPSYPYPAESCSKGESLWLHKRSIVKISLYAKGGSAPYELGFSPPEHVCSGGSAPWQLDQLKSHCMVPVDRSTKEGGGVFYIKSRRQYITAWHTYISCVCAHRRELLHLCERVGGVPFKVLGNQVLFFLLSGWSWAVSHQCFCVSRSQGPWCLGWLANEVLVLT